MLVTCLIVKDEESMLQECLESLQGLTDAVVVCDTGSSDNSVALALSMGAIVVHHPWQDDFSAARNVALAKAVEIGAEWVISIDADERLSSTDIETMREILAVTNYDVLEVFIWNAHGPLANPRPAGAPARVARVFKAREVRWRGKIHEQLTSAFGDELNVGLLAANLLRLDHLGYCEDFAERKRARNLRIAQSSYDEDKNPSTTFELARAYALNFRTEEATVLHKEALQSKTLPGNFRRAALGWLVLDSLENKKNEIALSWADELLALGKPEGAARFLKAAALTAMHRYQEALSAIDGVVSIHDASLALDTVRVHSMRVSLLSELNQPYGQAIADLLEVDAEHPLSVEACARAAARNPGGFATAISKLSAGAAVRSLAIVGPHFAAPVAEDLWARGLHENVTLAWAKASWQHMPVEQVVLWSVRMVSAGVKQGVPVFELLENGTCTASELELAQSVADELRQLV